MAWPPIVTVTIQSCAMSVFSNIVAQAITAYQQDQSFVIDWHPIIQFLYFTVVSTPPNYLWQEWLESSFPSHHIEPTASAIDSAAKDDEKELEKKAKEGKLVEPKLNKGNTAIKLLLDQTIGGFVNTFIFSLFMHSIKMAMPSRTSGTPDYSLVNWGTVVERSQAEFWPIQTAAWKFWPFVALFNFMFVRDLQVRSLIGGVAGIAWGVFMAFVAAGQ